VKRFSWQCTIGKNVCRVIAILCATAWLAGCHEPKHEIAGDNLEQNRFKAKRIESENLPNAVQLHPRVFSGGLPTGDAFKELAEMGVRTIVSVDGAKPNVELAEKNGLRYVHLPHGYDGINETQAKELAKAVQELDGPIYIHCHHGKHRSPAAAAIACVGAGLIPADQSIAVLELAGTSPDYTGLYKSAREATRFENEELEQMKTEFRSTTEVPPMAKAMVDIEHTFDHLLQLSKNRWQVLSDHPDLIPAHEALILQEHFTEMLRTDEAKSFPEQFNNWLRTSEASAIELHSQLKELETASPDLRQPKAIVIDAALMSIKNDCSACHRQFRN
jgi:protein tyrosine phosphatase (PTP) superfamily phosphohydrolase (DUF442 family)